MFENRSFLGQLPRVTLNLLLINLIFWFATFVFQRVFGVDLTSILGMHYILSDQFHLFQLVTYMFMHGSFTHLFFNMFGLVMFGAAIERMWGVRRFLIFYFVTGVGAALVQQLFWFIDYYSVSQAFSAALSSNSPDPLLAVEGTLRRYFRFDNLQLLTSIDVLSMRSVLYNLPTTVGASGALFGIMLAFGWLFPDAKMFLMFIPIPIPARIFVGLYAVSELFFGVVNFSGDNIAHFAHLGGMIFGLVLILIWRRRDRRFY